MVEYREVQSPRTRRMELFRKPVTEVKGDHDSEPHRPPSTEVANGTLPVLHVLRAVSGRRSYWPSLLEV